MARPSKKSRFFKDVKPQPPDDFKALEDWVRCIKLHLKKDTPSEFSPMIFLPDQRADAALMRLGMRFAEPVRAVRDAVDRCRYRTEKLDGNEATQWSLADAIMLVMERVNVLLGIVSDAPMPEAAGSRAHLKKLFSGKIPQDPDLVDLIVLLDNGRDSKKSEAEIAREFKGEAMGSDPKAKKLLARARKLRREGNANY